MTLLVLSGAVIWLDSNGRRVVQSGSVDRLEGAAKLLWQGRSVALTLTTPIYLIAEAPYTLYGSAADISIDRQSFIIWNTNSNGLFILSKNFGNIVICF